MRVTGQFPFCSGPMSVDSYRGCQGTCVYCFAQNRQDAKGLVSRGKPMPVEGPGIFHPSGRLNASSWGKLAVHLGGIADALPKEENKVGRTATFIEKVLPGRAVILSTKGDVREFPAVLRAMQIRPGAFLYQVSVETDSEKIRYRLEGDRQATIAQRLGAIEAVAKLGIPTVIRMQPFVRGWWKGLSAFVQRVADAGARGVIVEHLKFGAGVTNWDRLKAACDELGTPLEYLGRGKTEGDKSLPIKEKVANYLEVASIAHAKGLACFSGDNALRPLGDSPYCCGQELMADFDESWVFAGNLTAQAWRGRRIMAAACGNDDVPGNALTSCGLSQDTAGCLQMNHMMLPELMVEWARSDFRMQGILPYAVKIEPGVWEQTEEWLKFCQGIRRPLRKP